MEATEHQSDAAQSAAQPLDGYQAARLRLQRVHDMMLDGTLREGEHYGKIPGAKSQKPTLFKPGAQLLMAVFDLAPEIKDIRRVWNMDMIAYEVIVIARNKLTGVSEAEGVGQCNSNEKRFKGQGVGDVANTVLKIGKKRALIDACLDATGVASIFTQDLDELQHDAVESPASNGNSAPRGGHAPNQNRAAQGNTAQSSGISDDQRKAINALSHQVFGKDATKSIYQHYQKGVAAMDRSEASNCISWLKGELAQLEAQPQEAQMAQEAVR